MALACCRGRKQLIHGYSGALELREHVAPHQLHPLLKVILRELRRVIAARVQLLRLRHLLHVRTLNLPDLLARDENALDPLESVELVAFAVC